jgi:hypothetical protein
MYLLADHLSLSSALQLKTLFDLTTHLGNHQVRWDSLDSLEKAPPMDWNSF